MSSRSPKYLSGLDSLRWLSALAVLVTHVELHKGYHGLENYWDRVWVRNLGPVGVYFFFTLSGFLITWLLLRERNRHPAEVLPSFYLRRACRILPLYYLMVVLGFAVFPAVTQDTTDDVWLGRVTPELIAFASGQPHVASAFLRRVPFVSHLWSIGVELTFYGFWPFIVLYSRRVQRSAVRFVVLALLCKAVLALAARSFTENPQPWFHLAATLKFECMAIGGWFAMPHSRRITQFIDHRIVPWAAISLVPVMFLFYGTVLDDAVHLPMSAFFGVIIRSTLHAGRSPVHLVNNSFFGYLGQISYGIYCYHVFCIGLAIRLTAQSGYTGPSGNLLLYALTIALTVFVSAVSFHFFEYPITAMSRRLFVHSPLSEGSCR